LPAAPAQKRRMPIRWHDEWTQLRTLLRRSFMSKLRNRANLVITIGVAPVLALLIASILRYSDSGTYDFASAYHIPTFLFLALIVAMFLGLTNSADDIIRDRAVLQRERNLSVRLPYYVFAKTASLAVFALVQCILFVWLGNYVLAIRGMFWIDLGIVFMTAMSGVALGLVVSSLVGDPKTAANIVPLVLIPQIIMGGALIKYEDMNRNLALLHTFSRWFNEHPNSEESEKMDSKLQVPLICQFVAMRWSYEEIVVAQAKLNPLTRRQDRANDLIKEAAKRAQTPTERKRLDDLKEALALLSGLEAKSAAEIDKYLSIIDEILDGKRPFDRALFKDAVGPVTADQLYVNQKISDLISNAEMEQNDYRRGGKPNVFFGLEKRYFGIKFDVFTFNTAVLIGSTLALLGLLHWILRRQLQVRRS
jgi:ABC-type multidrug transport system permease subunit